jgi:hypothetical protein
MTAEQWLKTIAAYDRDFQPWQRRVDNILKRYRDDSRQSRDGYEECRFNILWSNVQTLYAATFARIPKPDVSRRFRDQDPVGRVAALILERALDYEINQYPDYRTTLGQCVHDRFLGGRGTAWVRYEPHIRQIEMSDGLQVTEDAEAERESEMQEEVDYECAPVDYVHWKDFGHTNARTWEEVTAVWRRVYLGRQACVERFGEEVGGKIPLDSRPDEDKKLSSNSDAASKACIYEVWDKDTSKAYWISKSLGTILDERDDPLGLEEFFPCPPPLYATITNESLVPLPDFTLYQDQARELDTLSDRIDGLIRALQIRGVFDNSIPELSRLFTEGTNNNLFAVKNWAAFAEKNGLAGAIDLVDLTPFANALREAYMAFEQVKSQVYEITGISDIIRGQTQASETATAQQIKGQYASLRLRSYQEQVARFATDILRMKARIICKHFSPQTIVEMSAAQQLAEADQQYIGPALQLLQDSKALRNFRIDIAADTLVQIDEQAEKEARVEFLTATGTFLRQAGEIGMAAPELVPLLMELLKFGVQGFKVGKTIEGAFDTTVEQLKQSAQQKAMQPPPPDPRIEMEKMRAQAEQQRTQMEMQREGMAAQTDQQKAAMGMQTQQAKNEAERMKAEASIIVSSNKIREAAVKAATPPKPVFTQ